MALSDAERQRLRRDRLREERDGRDAEIVTDRDRDASGVVEVRDGNVTRSVTSEGVIVTETVTVTPDVTLVTAGNVTERLAVVASKRDLRIAEMQRGRDVTGLVHAPAGKVRRVVDIATMSEAEMKMVPGVWLGPSKEQLAALGSTSLGGRK